MNAVSWELVTVSVVREKAIAVNAVDPQPLSCRLHPCRADRSHRFENSPPGIVGFFSGILTMRTSSLPCFLVQPSLSQAGFVFSDARRVEVGCRREQVFTGLRKIHQVGHAEVLGLFQAASRERISKTLESSLFSILRRFPMVALVVASPIAAISSARFSGIS